MKFWNITKEDTQFKAEVKNKTAAERQALYEELTETWAKESYPSVAGLFGGIKDNSKVADKKYQWKREYLLKYA